MTQLEAIRHEIRSISFMNPGPLTTRLVDNIANQPPVTNVAKPPLDNPVQVVSTETTNVAEDQRSTTFSLSDIHSQASTYARLAESTPLPPNSMDEVLNDLKDESGQFIVLPISAESAKLLPSKEGELRGSDILLEAVLEKDVAQNAKSFFLQAHNNIKVNK